MSNSFFNPRICQGALILTTLALSGLSAVSAQQIGPDGFGPSPVVQDFTGLGLFFSNATPLVLNGATYSTDTNTFRYVDFGSSNSFGEAIGNDTDTGFVQVVLDTPVLQAGGYVGASSSLVSFFDSSNVLLGTVTTADTSAPAFAGFQSLDDPIKTVIFTDTDANNRILILDRFTTGMNSPVPEASTTISFGLLLALGMGGVVIAGKRRRASVAV